MWDPLEHGIKEDRIGSGCNNIEVGDTDNDYLECNAGIDRLGGGIKQIALCFRGRAGYNGSKHPGKMKGEGRAIH
jgi:hypothetical protein